MKTKTEREAASRWKCIANPDTGRTNGCRAHYGRLMRRLPLATDAWAGKTVRVQAVTGGSSTPWDM